MRPKTSKILGPVLAAAVVVTTVACQDFLQVRNPNVIDAATVDPEADGPTFSRSAFQTFASAYGTVALYTAWFTAEAWVGDTFPTRNEFGRRDVDDRNSTFGGVWNSLQMGLAQSLSIAEILERADGAASDVNVARARLAAGFATQLQAEAFCLGTIRISETEPAGALSVGELLDAAAANFESAASVGAAAGGSEGNQIAGAARVGLARAHLQAGRHGQAISAASQVDPDFLFEVPYVDQPGARGRLGNGLFQFSAGGSRESLVVPPVYREMGVDVGLEEADPQGDPRIPYMDAGRDAQDGVLRFWTQRKFDNWAAPIRLASGLEARYIIAEAEYHQGNPAPALALINERREVGNQGVFVGTGDAVLRELMDQRSRDFWLEAKRMGDWRRNPGHVPNILDPNEPYYKPDVGTMSDDTCWPIPFTEYNSNPQISGPTG